MSRLTLQQRESLQKCGKREKVMGTFTAVILWLASVYFCGHMLAWNIISQAVKAAG